MPPAVPIALGIAGIGGAAIGLLALVMAVSSNESHLNAGTVAVMALCAGLYLCSAYCGVIALQQRFGWLRANLVLWTIQIPVFASPIVSYTFATGACLGLWVRPSPLGAGVNYFLGSNVAINFMTPAPFMVGVNAGALMVALYLRQLERKARFPQHGVTV